ncbi:MAG: hypothetical protein KDE58_43135, partial [Caldilineaceae bacterium]|nr:hypothetical protein [Caldilineaceae bacterium]
IDCVDVEKYSHALRACSRSAAHQPCDTGRSASNADEAIVPIADVHRGTLRALKYARLISHNVRAICVSTSPEQRTRVECRWRRFPELTDDIKLIFIDYDYRDVLEPLVNYISHANNVEFADQLTTVVIPEFISSSLPAQMLYNQTANILRMRLRTEEDLVIIDVPYLIKNTDGS